MMTFIERWIEFTHSRVNEIVASVTSGAFVANGFDDEWNFTLSDASTILGMCYISSLLIPRLYEFGKWIKNKWEKRNDRDRDKL